MFDIDLPGGESYRESANYQPGETAVISDLPGAASASRSATTCASGAVSALAESGASFLTVPSAFTKKTGEAHWHTCCAPAHREWLLRIRRGPGRHAREQARDLWSLADHCPWGEVLAEGAWSPALSWPGSTLQSRDRAETVPSLQHGRRFSVADPKAGPEHLHLVRGSA